jgi:hypothetical protein
MKVATLVPGSSVFLFSVRSSAAAVCIFALLLLSAFRAPAQTPAQTLPDFTFFRPDERPFTGKDLPKGRKMFFVLFDTECPHCQRALKSIDQQRASFNKAAVFLVSMDPWEKIRLFMRTYAPHLEGQHNVSILRDKQYQFIGKFKPRKFPGMLLYSQDRNLLEYEDNAETVFRFIRLLSGK